MKIARGKQVCKYLPRPGCIKFTMTRLKFLNFSDLRSAVVFAALLLACAPHSHGQSVAPASNDKPEGHALEPIEEEMRVKRSIKLAEKEHKENLDRAHLLSALSVEIGQAYKEKAHFDRNDLKKLEKLEKLTKSIRSAAGGSDDAEAINKTPPDLAEAVSKMMEVADDLRDKVKKTPRRVVSAAVIDQANVLLELIRRVRGLSRQG